MTQYRGIGIIERNTAMKGLRGRGGGGYDVGGLLNDLVYAIIFLLILLGFIGWLIQNAPTQPLP